MTAWTKLVAESGLLTRLDELGPAIDRALAREHNAAADVEGLERIRSVLTVIGQRLEKADSNLLVEQSLKALASHVAMATEHVKTFAETGNQEALGAANFSVDLALSSLATFVFADRTERVPPEATDAYREAMGAHLRSFDAEADAQLARSAALLIQLTDAETRFDTAIANIQKDEDAFRASVATEREELMATGAEAQKQLEAAAAAASEKWQAAFAAAENAREELWRAAADAQQARFDRLSAAFDEQLTVKSQALDATLKAAATAQETALTDLKAAYQDKAQAIVKTAEGHLKHVQQLVGVIADHGVSSGFKTVADSAAKAAALWQAVALGAILLLVGFAFATAVNPFDEKMDWLNFAGRTYFSITLGVLAAYAASQRNRCQQVEQTNRKIELELRALGPFFDSVDPDEREKFRLKLVDLLFGRAKPSHEASPTSARPTAKDSDKQLTVMKALEDKLPK